MLQDPELSLCHLLPMHVLAFVIIAFCQERQENSGSLDLLAVSDGLKASSSLAGGSRSFNTEQNYTSNKVYTTTDTKQT